MKLEKPAPDSDENPLFIPPTKAPAVIVSTPSPEISSLPTEKIVCEDKLTFTEDVTVPDGTVFSPNAPIDKQWKVTNSGVCNWDDRYTIRLIQGNALGAEPEQVLFPARSGSEFIIQIKFTAPQVNGNYRSVWQASNPEGMLFGDPFYMDIFVSR